MVTILLLLLLGLFIGYGNLLGLIIAFVIIVIVFLAISSAQDDKKKEEQKKKAEERKAIREKVRREKEAIFYDDRLEYVGKYGEPDNEIIIAENDINQVIMVFGNVGRILIMGKDLPFCDILSFSFDNHFYTRRGKVNYESSVTTNNGSMLGRSVVGGALGGKAGAIIGASTASKDIYTTATHGRDIVIHDYNVIVNINSLSCPIIRVPLGYDGVKANEIAGLLNVIINQK